MTKRLIIIIIAFLVVIGAGYGVIQYLGGKPSETSIIEMPVGEQKIITIEGEIVCLPGKSGRNSLECAIGLLGEDGNYYGLKNLNQEDLIDGKYPIGKQIEVSGTFITKGSETSKYDISGTIIIFNTERIIEKVKTMDTTNWKIYQNKEFRIGGADGFEFKYPIDWTFRKFTSADSNALITLGAKGDLDNNILPTFSMGASKGRGAIWVAFGTGSSGPDNLNESIKHHLKDYGYIDYGQPGYFGQVSEAEIIKEEDIIVDGRISRLIYIKRNKINDTVDRWVFIPTPFSNSIILGIVFDEPPYDDIFNQIIPTFKFIE